MHVAPIVRAYKNQNRYQNKYQNRYLFGNCGEVFFSCDNTGCLSQPKSGRQFTYIFMYIYFLLQSHWLTSQKTTNDANAAAAADAVLMNIGCRVKVTRDVSKCTVLLDTKIMRRMSGAALFFSTTTAAPDQHAADEPWIAALRWMEAIISPVNLLFGFPCIVLVLVCMPYTSIGRKPRMFYVLIACFTILPHVFLQLFIFFVKDAMMLYRQSNIYFSLEATSVAVCQFSRFAIGTGDQLSALMITLLGIQRFVAIRIPFKARAFTLARNAMCVAAVAVVAVGVNCLAFGNYGSGGNIINPNCSPIPSAATSVVIVFIINYIIPNCLILLSAVLVFWALKGQPPIEEHIGTTGTTGTLSNRKKGKRVTVVLLIIAAIRCAVYIPYSLLYTVYVYIPDKVMSVIVRSFANYFAVLSGSTCICDFIVYLANIPDFRRRLYLLFSCKPWYV
jgi:hypothetical protein